MAAEDPRVDVTICERLQDGTWLFAFASSNTTAFEWMVSQVKTAVHPTQREWMPDRRCWRISGFGMRQLWARLPDLQEPMERMAREAPHQQSGQQSGQQSSQRQQRTRSNVAPVETAEAFAVLFLLPSAPLPVIKAVYRALANLHHPDHGGTHEQMLRLNKAHEIACAWAKKQTSKAS